MSNASPHGNRVILRCQRCHKLSDPDSPPWRLTTPTGWTYLVCSPICGQKWFEGRNRGILDDLTPGVSHTRRLVEGRVS